MWNKEKKQYSKHPSSHPLRDGKTHKQRLKRADCLVYLWIQ